MAVRKALRKFFSLRRITLRSLVILLLIILFLGFLVTFGVRKILETTEKYNIKYYEPKDFQREEMLKYNREKR